MRQSKGPGDSKQFQLPNKGFALKLRERLNGSINAKRHVLTNVIKRKTSESL